MKSFLDWIRGLFVSVVVIPILALLLFMVALPVITIIATFIELIYALTCPKMFVRDYLKEGPLFARDSKSDRS